VPEFAKEQRLENLYWAQDPLVVVFRHSEGSELWGVGRAHPRWKPVKVDPRERGTGSRQRIEIMKHERGGKFRLYVGGACELSNRRFNKTSDVPKNKKPPEREARITHTTRAKLKKKKTQGP